MVGGAPAPVKYGHGQTEHIAAPTERDSILEARRLLDVEQNAQAVEHTIQIGVT